MSLKKKIIDDCTSAMKAGDKDRVSTLRMLRSKVQEAEVRGRGTEGPDFELDDDGTIKVLASYAKQRRESIDSYRKGGRDDLAAKEEAELAIVQEYLPEQMSPDRIRAVVKETIEEIGASSPRDMGAVMKAVMPRLGGAADGKTVNQLVREMLGSGNKP